MLSLCRGLTHITCQQMRCSFSQQTSSSVRGLNDRTFSTNYFDFDDENSTGSEQLLNALVNFMKLEILDCFGQFHSLIRSHMLLKQDSDTTSKSFRKFLQT